MYIWVPGPETHPSAHAAGARAWRAALNNRGQDLSNDETATGYIAAVNIKQVVQIRVYLWYSSTGKDCLKIRLNMMNNN